MDKHLQISKDLALALGYSENDIQIFDGSLVDKVIGHERPRVQVLYPQYVHSAGKDIKLWRDFDYRDPNVIWPIAERYNCFPRHDKFNKNWYCTVSDGPCTYTVRGDTAAEAVALTAIEQAEDWEASIKQDEWVKDVIAEWAKDEKNVKNYRDKLKG